MEFNLNEMIRPHLVGVNSYQTLRDSYIDKQAVYLDANENPFGEFNRYPDGDPIQLKKKLAEINLAKTENLFLGNGSDELIDLTMRIFCEPAKDSILIMNPSFVMYQIYAKMNNLQVEKLELNSDFELEKDWFLNTVSKSQAKVLFLCSPNNPTGNSIADLEFYIQNFNGIVVVDEAYIEFSPEDSTVSLLNKYPNLIVLKTLSKAFGMAGLRIGIGLSSPEIASLFIQLKPPYNISSESQKLALEKLNKVEEIENNISFILEEKRKLKEGLDQINEVVKIYPSDANFFLVEFEDAQLIYQKLLDKNILTSLRHPNLKNCLRISVGTAEENSQLLKVLSEINQS
ncbi:MULTISPECIES: histidinol-phosphate transaminase [unclassified Kaistella]|uniref:histidinol-phosphate transaminase n=1 Tax=unclassified Kaistella TaxID=2762626 RepID=UPI002735DF14|nr:MULTISPECIES: histidinol-phosphate transaminase [unclassified Kaistella]MDP2454777.1 histidinol-phosphate transaminase [Kaistella sp. SH11-4b]MDP2457514.1 histidinol-phosphate transaminase [Kaistella sp. SH40-3]MDP2460274.1 histidinol-phosphate transaminase [Kaistella sp. SH19-2b]